jgi:hypothetical protein
MNDLINLGASLLSQYGQGLVAAAVTALVALIHRNKTIAKWQSIGILKPPTVQQ